MNEKDNTTLIQNIYAAFGRGDIPAILGNLAPDAEWIAEGPDVIPFSGKKVGPGEIVTFFQSLAATQEQHKLTIDEYIAQGDKVVSVGRYSAVVKATGKAIDCPLAHIWTIRDGKVSRYISFTDTAQMADGYISSAAAAH